MSENTSTYTRFTLSQRVEHMVLLLSFTILAITGLIQKFSGVGVSQWTIGALGGIEIVRIIHRISAIVLMILSVYHIGSAGYSIFVLRRRPALLPTFNDVRAGVQGLLYNLGLAKTRPQQGRFTFEEKIEYWAVVWGTVVMAITGFVLWNPISTARLLPGEFIPAAKEVHGGEALLAVLAIIVWHMYHVHIRQFNRSMFTGHLTEEEMREEHPLQLADIKAGITNPEPDPKEVERRRRVYLPVFGVIAAVMAFGIYQFATIEETAIETVPNPREVAVFAPLPPTPFPTAPPTPVPPPQAAAPTTWEGGISSLFQGKCAGCHGAATHLGNLNLASFASTMTGGDDGPGVVPGNPGASQVVVVQEAGGHPAQFTPDELELIRTWIEAGAPEN